MGLVKCTECGKEFSDKAIACPNCGCPTEFILKELKSSTNNKAKDVIAKYNIWGYEFIIDKEIDTYIRITNLISSGRDEYIKLIEKQYHKWGNIDELISNMPEFFSEILAEMVSGSVNTLVQLGIYSCDKKYFMEKYGNSLNAGILMEPIIERYLAIQDLREAAIEYREYVRQQRLNTWQGGGFGIEGALKGYFKAQMLNVGVEFLHMHSDNKSHIQNMAEIANAKRELYYNENTKKSILTAFTRIYDTCYNAILKEMVLSGAMSPYPFDRKKTVPIFNNVVAALNAGNYSDLGILRKQCLKAFQEDPTSYHLIELMLYLNDGVENEDLVDYADQYGYLETFNINEQIRLKEKYSEEINEIDSMCSSSIASNIMLFEVWDSCEDLYYEGIDVDEYFLKAIEARIKFDVSEEELEDIRERIQYNLEEEVFSEELALEIQKKLDNIEIDTTDRMKLEYVIQEVCNRYAEMKWYKSTKLYDSDFYFSSSCEIEDIQNFEKFEDYANIPKDAEIFMLWGWCGLYDEVPKRVVAVADSGLYTYFNNEIDGFSKTWKQYAEDRFGQSINKIKTGKNEIHTGDSNLYTLLKDIRLELRKFYNLDTLQDGDKQVSEQVPKEISEQVKNVCDEFSLRFYLMRHYFSKKTDLKDSTFWVEEANALHLPDSVEIYYMYPTAPYHIALSELGIHFSSSMSTGFISWLEFIESKITQVDKSIIRIGEKECHTNNEAKFLVELLQSIQHAIRKKVYSMPGRYYNVGTPNLQYKEMLKKYDVLAVTECNEADLVKLCLDSDVKFEEIFNEINVLSQKGIEKPVCFIHDKDTHTYIYITSSYLMAIGAEKKVCVPLDTLMTIKIDLDKNEVMSLFIYHYNEKANTVYENIVPISNSLKDVNLQPFINALDRRQPFRHAMYYQYGTLVTKNNDKAIELYEMVLKEPENTNKAEANYNLGIIYSQEGELVTALKFYLSATETSSEFSVPAFYEIAMIEYTPNTKTDGITKYYHSLYCMDIAAQDKYKDARERLMVMLCDSAWMRYAYEEARKDSKEIELQDIIKREGRTQVEYAADKVKETAKKAKEKLTKFFKL